VSHSKSPDPSARQADWTARSRQHDGGGTKMELTDRLGQLLDAFSRRQKAHGPGCKPATISQQLRGRIFILYSEVVTGRLSSRIPGYDSDRFFVQMHQALRLLYGRVQLSATEQRTQADDVMTFAGECSAEELFDFIETGFKLEVAPHIFHDEKDFVDALNNIFRMEGAPFQLLHGIVRQQQEEHYISHVRVAFPRVVRVDEQLAHTEAILPALAALGDPSSWYV
jgi:hypothetical protein